ncbi:MAG: hypothetical protein NTY48_00750 [Candidatus Diapherotrites archaeon]|nr:hypothetical protein [Candidatus Diapherotrites archaeon]
MFLFYIYPQLLRSFWNIEYWASAVLAHNPALIIIFLILFGITFSFQTYYWFRPKVCPINKKVESAGSSALTFIGVFLISQCPSCATLGLLLIPISAASFILQYNWAITLISIIILLFTLNYSGAFQKDNKLCCVSTVKTGKTTPIKKTKNK